MQNENEPLTYDYSDALNELIALGLVDVVAGGYRLSESLNTAEFAPNAALHDRLKQSI